MDEFTKGVLMAASVIISLHDCPVIAADMLKELDAENADCSGMDDFDKMNLRKVQRERGVRLRGLRKRVTPNVQIEGGAAVLAPQSNAKLEGNG